ncbi:polysaccharide deacetylase family protein [Halolamina salifodinae]|uniref:Peptidoglycan/xylan/chitin deacetylase (PgdA/CDA1 family) n=1 Tax=Halolamina salifodinae TaxID=1202767 RepID=A0A8T4GXL6_9EURY|nr:polysaccharide deacetylase [Halolamina salifodinae]MBP1987719.1 peptidoglycan/xylan/chitin deacetylase (PgdA/CDA1 family) [Halolamina salifodinae]
MTRATVCLTVDFDAVSPWLHAGEFGDSPVQRSRGRFGAEVGAPRLLGLFDRLDVPSTWFIPGHTIDSFPEPCQRVVDEGHEVGHHGWSHTPPGEYESREAERADVARGIESIEDLTGSAPAGYRSPSWDFSPNTVSILQEFGFEWSSSGMAREFEPYELREEHAPVDDPYELGDPVGITEVPVSWQRDDYPALAFSGNRAFSDEAAVFDHWRRQFDWMYEQCEEPRSSESRTQSGEDGGIYVITLHPQVSGRSPRPGMLRELIEHMAAKPGVEFARVSDVV